MESSLEVEDRAFVERLEGLEKDSGGGGTEEREGWRMACMPMC